MACFLTINRMYAEREGTLFIDPGFPVQKQQCRVLGHDFMSFDVYDYRGPKLRDKLLSYLDTGKVSSILYSNPNNPAWICLTESELETIARLADEYDVVVIEDLAYFGMDFRRDYSRPGVPPFQPSVARHTGQLRAADLQLEGVQLRGRADRHARRVGRDLERRARRISSGTTPRTCWATRWCSARSTPCRRGRRTRRSTRWRPCSRP